MKKLSSILFILLFIGCTREKEVDLKIPFKQKLVSAIFIGEGDSMFTAILTYTTPVFNTPPSQQIVYATKAKAQIKNNGNNYDLFYQEPTSNYESAINAIKVKANETYYLEANDGKEIVTGFTTIPEEGDFDIDLKLDSSNNDAYFYNAKIKCKLISNQKIAVKLVAIMFYNDSSFSLMSENIFLPITELNKGEVLERTLSAVKPNEFTHPVRIECYGVVCNDVYKNYYNATSGINFSSFLPLGEPNITYSNLSNKIGIIASYNASHVQTFKFE